VIVCRCWPAPAFCERRLGWRRLVEVTVMVFPARPEIYREGGQARIGRSCPAR